MTLHEGLERIRWIALNIIEGYDPADKEKFSLEIKWLSSSLRTLAFGNYVCAKEVLGIKPKRGQRFKKLYVDFVAEADQSLNIRAKQEYLLWAATIAEFGMRPSERARALDCREWLGKALLDIANGRDIEDALNIKPSPSERKNLFLEDLRQFRDEMLIALVYTLMQPNDLGGYGVTLEDACAIYAGDFSLRDSLGIGEDSVELDPNLQVTEDYLRKLWNSKPELRDTIKAAKGCFR